MGPGGGESSSKDTAGGLEPSGRRCQGASAKFDGGGGGRGGSVERRGITEFHIWDPHKAAKDIEVGDFYFKRQNYRAAEDRYREALRYKDNDAVATIRLAVCLEKLRIWDDARAEYESYLKILPHGPQASEAQKAINRLKAQTGAVAARALDRIMRQSEMARSFSLRVSVSGGCRAFPESCPAADFSVTHGAVAASPRIRFAGHFGPEHTLSLVRLASTTMASTASRQE